MVLNKSYIFLFILIFCCWHNEICAQEIDVFEETEFIEQTFFNTRVANNHSSETLERGYLDFRLSHRMGRISSGVSEMFGLNQAFSQFALEYGITNNLMFGVNTNSSEKIYSGFIKFKFIKQSTGKVEMPLTMTWFSNSEIKTGTLDYPNNQYYFSSRLFFTHQLIISRKFTDKISFQISPTLVHKNMVKTRNDNNNIFLTGIALRYKFKRKMAFNAEYNYVFPGQIYSDIDGHRPVNCLSVGIDIYTGKHNFQLFFTNAVAMNEKSFLTETTENVFKKGIHFGFNITRLFNIVNYYE
ncbi:MAG: DUF5777 family beta-barrel protein [Bacteroidales bacterium]|nr:DUF5777 family beta-barrel protein [Bacteroidales bacterium]